MEQIVVQSVTITHSITRMRHTATEMSISFSCESNCWNKIKYKLVAVMTIRKARAYHGISFDFTGEAVGFHEVLLKVSGWGYSDSLNFA